MPYNVPTLDGQPVFGLVTEFTPTSREAATQDSAFFGQDGILSLWGGLRGWTFHIAGCFQESDLATINADIAALLSFRGPGLHTFVDTRGVVWNNVRVRGRFAAALASS